MDNHQDGNENEEINDENLPQGKEILCTGVRGTVKWFNVKLRYGFVCRHDTKEDVFIHQSAIAKANPNHPRKSVDDNEEIVFDVVSGAKGVEAANVTGIDGNCVKGSDYALIKFRGRGRGGSRGMGRGYSGETGRRTQDYYRNGGGRGRPMGLPRSGPNQSENVKRNTEIDPEAQQLLDEQRKAKMLIREEEKECLCTRVTGKVKWFNVKRGYGFVCRNDNQEDVFIHHSAIVKNNPEHARKSVEDGEEILFDIVRGSKGNEVSNVSALDGNCVKGSEYARRFPRYNKPRNPIRSREISEAENFPRPFNRGGPPFTRGGPRPYRARPFQSGHPQFRDGYAPEMPPYGNDFEYYYGPPPPHQMMPNRGVPRGSRFPGRMFPPRGRGGFPRDFPPINDFYPRRPMRGRGPPRGRGRMGGRGGRGWNGGRGGYERNDDRVESRDDEEPGMNGEC